MIVQEKAELQLGPELLRERALRAMKKLVRLARSRETKKQMSQDITRMSRKMNRFVQESMVALQQLPDVQILCSTEQFCVMVDNSVALDRHITAMRKLSNQTIRALNRATRVVYTRVEDARRATQKFGRETKRYTKQQIGKANALPRVRYSCP